MKLTPNFLTRDFALDLVLPAVNYLVDNYTVHVIGGPRKCTITAYGDRRALWECVGLLRCPVEVTDERGTKVWWGCVDSVAVRVGGIEVEVSLDSMANRISLVYSDEHGARHTTAWSSDSLSIETYGTKELQARLGSAASLAGAEAKRNQLVGDLKYPVPSVALSGADVEGSLSATLYCKGWWETLDWTYYSNSAGREAYLDSGDGVQAVGAETANTYVAQSFTLTSPVGWRAATIAINCRKEGAPADNLVVELCANSAGAPGTVLASDSIAGTSLDADAYERRTFDIADTDLSPATTYWLKVSRSGSLDPDNYFLVDVNDELGYSGGVFRIWDGDSWEVRDPNVDMTFEVIGTQETTEQLRTILNEAQFLTGLDLENASGLYSSQFREGDSTALAEAEELLAVGTTANRRLLVTVSPQRRARVYLEPASAEATDCLLRSDLTVSNSLDNPIELHTCPVGMWVRLRDIQAVAADLGRIADPTRMFIEAAEYDNQTGRWKPEAKNKPSVWNVGGLEAG